MEENGLKDNIQGYYGNFTQASGNSLTRIIFEKDPKPTAIFATNNLIAIGALRALNDLGYRVPKDVALVSFDDIPDNLTMFPFMTAVSQPSYEMGKSATELLISRIKNETNADYRDIVYPVDFIKRDSSGSAI
jgi:DNA-binding LacI/PurR family transcriptional regulator